MAREKKAFTGPEEQEEMTVVILRFKGGGDTLRKGFDTVSQALAALGPAVPAPTVQRLRPPRAEVEVFRNGDKSTGNATADDPEDGSIEGENGNSADPRQPGGPRKYYTPKFLADLKLSPEGQTPWKEYAATKNPGIETDRYLVAAGWLTEHGGNEKFRIDHVFTCFRAMDWKMQKDPSQPIRQLKKNKSYFDSLARGLWKLTDIGLEYAKSLPKAAA
jgi:hypothetical protein